MAITLSMAAKRVQKAARERNAADGRLQVEADQRHLAGDRGAVLDDLVLAGALHRAQAQQHGVIAERAGGTRLLHGLRGLADHAGDHDQRPLGPARCGLGGQLQHRPVEADIADLELRGVHADGQPAGAGIDVVARQRALRAGGRTGAFSSSARGCAGSTAPRRRTARTSAGRSVQWRCHAFRSCQACLAHASSGPARAKMRPRILDPGPCRRAACA